MPIQKRALATSSLTVGPAGIYRFSIPGDGNCLFRAVCAQLGYSQTKHVRLHSMAVKWMRENKEHLLRSGLLDGDEEIEETAELGAWPGQAAIVALANIFSTNIALIQGGDKGDIDIQHITPFETPPEKTVVLEKEVI